jgi:hypothetical protein
MPTEPYVAQLLPSLKEARVIRSALMHYVSCSPVTSEDEDISYGLVAKLYMQMKDRGQ